MGETEATRLLVEAVSVTREDIARAKSFLLKAGGGDTDDIADRFMRDQDLGVPRKIDGTNPNCADELVIAGRAMSVRLAVYQAVWELIVAGELIPSGEPKKWEPTIDYKERGYGGGLRPKVGCTYPSIVERPPLPSDLSTDTDIFLQGLGCPNLHAGIREAITQALACFRRALYMPATAMLAAATEATWTECGMAVAKKLANTKMETMMVDSYVGIGKKVLETRKALEHASAKTLLTAAGQTIAKVNDAEAWTTILRDKRNALHWGKAKSFVVVHSDTANLLMAAPLHLGTLEAIRAAC